jgi:hypothetical protein
MEGCCASVARHPTWFASNRWELRSTRGSKRRFHGGFAPRSTPWVFTVLTKRRVGPRLQSVDMVRPSIITPAAGNSSQPLQISDSLAVTTGRCAPLVFSSVQQKSATPTASYQTRTQAPPRARSSVGREKTRGQFQGGCCCWLTVVAVNCCQ